MTSKSLYIFGDSICFGQYVSIHKTWAALLSSELERDEKFSHVITQVSAVNGETSRQALERIAFNVLHHRPSVVWAQFGLNDANYWSTDKGKPRVEPDEYVNNMLSIADQCLANGTSFVIVPTNHPVSRELLNMPKGAYSENARRYNDNLRAAVSAQKNSRIKLLDLERTFTDKALGTNHLLQDGVHLNESGHEYYFLNSIATVKSLLAATN